MKIRNRIIAMIMALALLAPSAAVGINTDVNAASAPILSNTGLFVNQSEGESLKVKFTAKKLVKTTWKASNQNVTLASKTKSGVVVVGKYEGTSTITAGVKYKVGKKTKTKKLTCKVTVNKANQTVKKSAQALPITSVLNARELGGYKTKDGWTVKKGMLLRTSKLDTASNEDLGILKNKYNVGLDIDLRIESEIKKAPDPTIEGVDYIKAPLDIVDKYDDPVKKTYPKNLYRTLLEKDPSAVESLSKALKAIVADHGKHAVLWHCTYGKDRTGLLAAILLSILNVDRQTILQDYMLTAEFMPDTAAGLDAQRIEIALDYMDQTSGSVDAYAREKLGLSVNDIYTLRIYYLEREPISLENALALPRDMDELKNVSQVMVVNGLDGTNADIGFYEKDTKGNWKTIFTTYGFIGRTGMYENRFEGSGASPVGVYHFTHAFGIADDPGCTAFPYMKLTDDDYWYGKNGPFYNQPVKKSEHPELIYDDDSEHLIEENLAYQYAMNISWNEKGEDGLGSAIFLHCFKVRPWTAGCVAIPEKYMIETLKKVKKDCAVVMGKNIIP